MNIYIDKGANIKHFGTRRNYNKKENSNPKVCTFSTNILIPIAISILSATILFFITNLNNDKMLQLENNYDVKLKTLESSLQNKLEYKKYTIDASKRIMNALSELNTYILFELNNEILNDIQELRLPMLVDTGEGLRKFKQVYQKNIHIIEQESIFLPKELYQKTKHSIDSINTLMSLNLLIMYDQDFFNGFSISFKNASQVVSISKETKNKIQIIVNEFYMNFKRTHEYLQEEYRVFLNPDETI